MRPEVVTADGAKSLLQTQMLVIKLVGVASRSTLVSEIKMLTIMKMAEPAEVEVVEDVVALRTKEVIVLSQRAASNAVRKVTFQENVLILAEAAAEVLQEEVVASSAARTVTWLVIALAVRQEVITTPRVVAEVEEELQAVDRVLSAIASNAKEKVILLEIAPMIMEKAILSPTRDRGEMKMVGLTAEEEVTTTMLLLLATVVSGETILHLPRTQVLSGEHHPTITPMPMLMPGEILTPATTTRHQMMHGAPATIMRVVAAAGTEQ
jgi:hypothetical protein